MNHFHYRNQQMYCESVPLRTIAEQVGTPCYIYSHATLSRHYKAFFDAFEGTDRLVCYSAKANSNMAVLKLMADLGGGLDIVSGGELYRGLNAGFKANTIVYSGVGKRVDEIDFALKSGILMFNIESIAEMELIDARAKELNCKAPIAIRVNPDVDPKTHPYISTGLKKNKFGIDIPTALETYKTADRYKHIAIKGVDCHIGSQITELQPFRDTLDSLINFIDQLQTLNVTAQYLDVGGGVGITYNDEKPPELNEYAQAVTTALKDRELTLILEPGRVIVGNAGILLTRVLYTKTGTTKNFVITDAAMNDLIRPTLYDAYHEIKPVEEKRVDRQVVDVVGPICETGDFLARERGLPQVQRNDLLAVMSAGAYGYAMSSNYCSRIRAAEVMVKGDQFHVVKQRETYEDLIAGESPFPSN